MHKYVEQQIHVRSSLPPYLSLASKINKTPFKKEKEKDRKTSHILQKPSRNYFGFLGLF